MYAANSGGSTPGRARSNDLAGRSTALTIALVVNFFEKKVHPGDMVPGCSDLVLTSK